VIFIPHYHNILKVKGLYQPQVKVFFLFAFILAVFVKWKCVINCQLLSWGWIKWFIESMVSMSTHIPSWIF
jgi:hypothetical protein